MALKKFLPVGLGAVLVLSSCSWFGDDLWPSLSGDRDRPADSAAPPAEPQTAQQQAPRPAPQPAPQPQAPPQPQAQQQPQAPAPAAAPQPTGTEVGKRVQEYRETVGQLQQEISQANQTLQQIRNKNLQTSQSYNVTKAAINTRLQLGTTPENPILRKQYAALGEELEKANNVLDEQVELRKKIRAMNSRASELSRTVNRTYNIPGALDEDHRQLRMVEDELARARVAIRRLNEQVQNDINHQVGYLRAERSDLRGLDRRIRVGSLGRGRVPRSAESASQPARRTSTPQQAEEKPEPKPEPAPQPEQQQEAAKPSGPLMIIKFSDPNVSYETQLFNAVSKTLDRQPGAKFRVVAVSPASGGANAASQAQANSAGVVKTLKDMGLPEDRITTSSAQSPSAGGNEVHIFVE